jgi:cell wall-associated NlpC family hydrolase
VTARPDFREAVVADSVVDLRASASARSERVTQVTLGTPLLVRRERDNWLHVTGPDAYRGWIPTAAVRRLPARAPRYASRGRVAVVTAAVDVVYVDTPNGASETRPVTVGVRLEVVGEEPYRFRVRLPDGRFGWVRKAAAELRPAEWAFPAGDAGAVVATAKRFLGVPYLWGGTTPLGFDCSGLVQTVYRLNGVALPRDADQQFTVGAEVARSEVRPGDLLFFSHPGDGVGITHIGLEIDGGKFLHATGRVRGVTINALSERFYRHLFVGAKRVLASGDG